MNIIKKWLMGLCCFFMIFATGCSQSAQSETILTINDRKISKPEFMVYLYETAAQFNSIGGEDIWETEFDGKTAEDLVKERTLESIQNVVLTEEQAKQYDISLSEDEKSLAKTEAKKQFDALSKDKKEKNGITLKTVEAILEDTLLYHKVFDEVTKDFQLSDADFQAYQKENRQDYTKRYQPLTVGTILVRDKAIAQKVITQARAGVDFEKLCKTYEIDETEKQNGATMETYLGHLEESFGTPFDLQEGEVSEPLETADGFYIIKVISRGILAENELLQLMKTDYITSKKEALFQAEFSHWIKKATIERNDDVYETITLKTNK